VTPPPVIAPAVADTTDHAGPGDDDVDRPAVGALLLDA
jgi:hypothetical protein